MTWLFRVPLAVINWLLFTIANGTSTAFHNLKLIAGSKTATWSFWLGLSAVGVFSIVGIFLAWIWAPVLGPSVTQADARQFQRTHERSKAISFWDAEDRYIGFMPGVDFEPDYREFLYKGCYSIGEREYCSDHKTMWVEDAPPHFWQCLSHLEDRHAGSAWNPGGIDLYGYGRVVPTSLAKTLRSGRPRFGAGGSTLAMQLSRSIRKTPPGDQFTPTTTRKQQEWYYAPVLFNMLNAPESKAWRRWNAMHLPLSTGSRGTLYGVEANALILFGRRAADLTPAEQYTLAAMVKYNPYRGENSERWRLTTYGSQIGQDEDAVAARLCENSTDASIPYKTGRARLCVDAFLSGPEREAANLQLKAMCSADPVPAVDPDLRPIFESINPDRVERMASTPQSISANISSDIQRAILGELRDRFGALPRTKVAEVKSSLDLLSHRNFKRRSSAVLGNLLGSKAAAINTRRFSFRPQNGKDLITVSLAIADQDGKVLRLYENSETGHYSGSLFARRRDTTLGNARAQFDPSLATREIASTGKMMVALALADAGNDTPQTSYNNACLTDRPQKCYCRSGRCRDKRARVTAETAFAQSLNDVLIRRVSQQSTPERLQKLLRAASFDLGQAHADTPTATRLTRGWIGGSPRQVQALSAAALDYALGGRGQAPVPSLVDQYRIYLNDGAVWTPTPETFFENQSLVPPSIDLGLTPSARGANYIRKVLSAPACHRLGSLRSALSKWCNRKDVDVFLVKTGTRGLTGTDARTPDNYEWWVTGAVAYTSGKKYSWVVSIGTGQPSQSFSPRTAAAAAPVANFILDEIDLIHAASLRDQDNQQ